LFYSFRKSVIEPMLPSTALHAGLSSPRFIVWSKAPRSSPGSAAAKPKAKPAVKLSPRSRIKPTMASSTDNAANLIGRASTSLDQHRSSSEGDKLFAAAAERNKAPILEALSSRLPESGLVLEVASGTGQHVAHFASHFLSLHASSSPGLRFLPTEADESSLPSIRAHAAGMANVMSPRVLDVGRDAPESWPRGEEEEGGARSTSGLSSSFCPSSSSSSSSSSSKPYAAIYCANLTHIATFAATLGLFRGAGALLRPGGALFLYGPFAVDGKPSTPSDLAFDASLRARDPRWGYRDIRAELVPAAEGSGLALEEQVEMPANNWLCVFRKKRG